MSAALQILPDHLQFLDHLSRQLAASPDARVGVVVVRLECVSRIDGMLGYRTGDEICQQLAPILRDALKSSDFVARLGRDQLGCILSGLSTDAHLILAVHKILRRLQIRLPVDSFQIHVTPVVGAALGPVHGSNADTLLQRANAAMQHAHTERERYFIFDQSREQDHRLQLELQGELRDTLSANGLRLQYQPQQDLRSGRIVGAEALARWTHPSRGPISPGLFIPIAEQTGLITPLTSWLMQSAFRHWQAVVARDPEATLSINLSPYNLLEPDLPEHIQHSLRTWNVPPKNLLVEVTESAAVDDANLYGNTLERIKDIGVQLSVDDFGTGYSSLTRLRTLPVDELKIDLTFVRTMNQSAQDRRIVRSIIDMAHNLDIKVVAEGVEDLDTLAQLAAYECDIVQGYFVSPPLDEDAYMAFAFGT